VLTPEGAALALRLADHWLDAESRAALTFTARRLAADPIVSVLVTLLIVRSSWDLVRESVDVLLESTPSHISLGSVRARLEAIEGVASVHDLHVWTVTSGMVAMSGHAIVPQLATHPEVLEAIRAELAQLGIAHVTIQLEVQHECEEVRAVAGSPIGQHERQGHRH
jgi:cation diffusion facilitator family transporter